jgi:amidophosphoribosyltransferase
LGYLSEEGLVASIGHGDNRYCKACFAGKYPVAFPKPVDIPQMGLFEEEQTKHE